MPSPHGSPDDSSYGEPPSPNHDDDDDDDGGNTTQSDDSPSIRSDHAQDYHEHYPEASSPLSDDGGSASSSSDEDFPPGYLTSLHETPVVARRLSAVLLPSYFFCPLTGSVMKDPVVTPDGYTFERRAILRCLVLSASNPFTGKPLSHEELREDRLVRGKIDKARREAWMRHVVEVRGVDWKKIVREEGGDVVVLESEEEESEGEERLDDTMSPEGSEGDSEKDEAISVVIDASSSSASSVEEEKEREIERPQNAPPPYNLRLNQNLIQSNFQGVLPANTHRRSDASHASSTVPIESNNIHGWNTPLGVHRVVCRPPGLVVTTTVHRRSAMVQRKVLQKKLLSRENTKEQSTKNRSVRNIPYDILQTQSSPSRNNLLSHVVPSSKHKTSKYKSNHNNNNKQPFQTTLTVTSQPLILPPGSYVEIIETVVHGGRVRGNICWEEEMAVELDPDLMSLLRRWEQEAETQQSRIPDRKREDVPSRSVHGKHRQNKTSKRFFRRKNSRPEEGPTKNPFSSELFAESPHREVARRPSPSPPPITTVKYTGWISLQWAGEEKARRGEEAGADEDEGPWSQPLPLGVYRIRSGGGARRLGMGQVSLSDAPDSERNVTHVLVESQCVEVVETRVVVMKRKITNKERISSQRHLFGRNAVDGVRGVRTVRARCMVPVLIPPMVPQDVDGRRCVNARAQKKFKSGWITLCTDDDDDLHSQPATSHLPLSLGAYIVVSGSGCAVTEGDRCDSKIKAILPCRSCIEVVTTRMEFEEGESLLTCHCGRERRQSVVAVRALLASGGHATLFVFPVGTSGTFDNLCHCGNLVQRTVAEPVPLGRYKVIHPGGVSVTARIRKDSPVVFLLEEGACVEITQTGVEDGCVRGRVRAEWTTEEDGATVGWMNLFEFPDRRWVEYVFEP